MITRACLIFCVLAPLGLTVLLQHYPSKALPEFNPALEMLGDAQRDVSRAGHKLTPFSTEWEIKIGDAIAKSMEEWGWSGGWFSARIVPAPAYITEVGDALIPYVRRKDIPYRFHVVESEAINAYSVAGGHIYITRGLLAITKSEAELATILGHEIAHVDLRHCIDQVKAHVVADRVGGQILRDIAGLASELFRAGFNKKEELHADSLGVQLAGRAKYYPDSFLKIYERMESNGPAPEKIGPPKTPVEEIKRGISGALDEYFQTHPPSARRLAQIQRVIARDRYTRRGRFYVGAVNYEKQCSRTHWTTVKEWVVKSD